MTKDTNNYRTLAENFLETRSEKDYNALYKKVKPGLRAYISNVVKDGDATQDILTNTLTKMWTKIDSIKSLLGSIVLPSMSVWLGSVNVTANTAWTACVTLVSKLLKVQTVV
jgi:F420-0:gamma-glutamyl ligase-like protein